MLSRLLWCRLSTTQSLNSISEVVCVKNSYIVYVIGKQFMSELVLWEVHSLEEYLLKYKFRVFPPTGFSMMFFIFSITSQLQGRFSSLVFQQQRIANQRSHPLLNKCFGGKLLSESSAGIFCFQCVGSKLFLVIITNIVIPSPQVSVFKEYCQPPIPSSDDS